MFDQELAIQPYEEVWRYAEKSGIERRMMQLAHGDPVRNPRLSEGFAVRHDMSRVEERRVPQSADRAARLVRVDHNRAKLLLVQPLPDFDDPVPALDGSA